jgi:hypothetical protein
MLEGLTPPKGEGLCIVGRQAAELSKEDLKILLAALEDKRWSSNALAEELTKRGFTVGRDSMIRHREKTCLCSKA